MSRPGSHLDPSTSASQTATPLDWSELVRVLFGIVLLGAVGASLGLALGFVGLNVEAESWLPTNSLARLARHRLLLASGSGAFVAILAGLLHWVAHRDQPTADDVLHVARRVSPAGVAGFLPYLFHWQLWKTNELAFLLLAGIALFCWTTALHSAALAGPLCWERPLWSYVGGRIATWTGRRPRLAHHLPLVLVGTGALAYCIYFSYQTLCWHWSVRSSYDLAIEDNVMWNVVHGNGFFKSTIIFGPVGSHFGLHATLFAYAMAPIYALAPRPETLLIIQSALLGGAAIPLYLWARRHVPAVTACIIGLLYLLYPPVHGANLYEFHYPPLGTFFLWTLLYALETRRDVLAGVALVLTLSVREDVSAGPMIWGAYLMLSGRRPKAGLVVALISAAYFVTMKMVIMPRLAGHEAFAFIYKDLIPPGEHGFGSILKTLLTNPAYSIITLAEPVKLVYLLQIFLPLAFLPLRRPLGVLFLVPGIFFSLLSTDYPPLVSIHYQYTAHWTTYLFVALVLVLAMRPTAQRWAGLLGMCFALLVCSYQFGAVFQTNTSFGGPLAYRFGMTEKDAQRHRAARALVQQIPTEAVVSASVFTTPQISSRKSAYQLTVGVFDAEYLLFPSEIRDFSPGERPLLTELLKSGEFGLVDVKPPFALARRGHDTARNQELLATWW